MWKTTASNVFLYELSSPLERCSFSKGSSLNTMNGAWLLLELRTALHLSSLLGERNPDRQRYDTHLTDGVKDAYWGVATEIIIPAISLQKWIKHVLSRCVVSVSPRYSLSSLGALTQNNQRQDGVQANINEVPIYRDHIQIGATCVFSMDFLVQGRIAP